jgi:hypothetical protein
MTVQRLIAIALAVAALWFGWRWLFPNDEAKIRAVLERIADAVGSGAAEEGEVARIARAASIRNQLDPQISVDAGPPFSQMRGRDTLIGAVARLNSTVRDLEVQFDDVQVSVAPDRATARVYMTAEAHFRDGAGGPGIEARELDVVFRRLEGDWVVSEVALVRTLEPVTPR